MIGDIYNKNNNNNNSNNNNNNNNNRNNNNNKFLIALLHSFKHQATNRAVLFIDITNSKIIVHFIIYCYYFYYYYYYYYYYFIFSVVINHISLILIVFMRFHSALIGLHVGRKQE